MVFFSMINIDMNKELERMIGQYGNEVLKTAYMYLKDIQSAEDAFQEVFIKVLKNYGSFKGESSEKTWIIKITINVCKDHLKSFWRRKVVPADEVVLNSTAKHIEDEAIANIEKQKLFAQVLSLPEQQKDVIILYYYHSFNTVEISKILGIPEGTVRSRLTRAREMLKKHISERRALSE